MFSDVSRLGNVFFQMVQFAEQCAASNGAPIE